MKTNRVFADENEIVECLHNEFRFCPLYRESKVEDLLDGDVIYQGRLTTCDEESMVHSEYYLMIVALYIGSPFNDYEYRYVLFLQ